jgi:FkbM family methyltransferase
METKEVSRNFIKSPLSRFAKGIIDRTAKALPRTAAGRYFCQQVLDRAMSREEIVHHGSNRLVFAVPNWLSLYRAKTFATKEPDTLEWIDALPEGSVLWDIGANVGIYTIYAAKVRKCKVFAFEPSVFNLELLARNIFLNGLQQQVTIVPLALSDKVGADLFKLTTMQWGGALSTFSQDFDNNGEPIETIFEYQTAGVSMTEAASRLMIQQPQFIKIDVDGMEHFILRGGAEILAKADSVLVEINDQFQRQAAESASCLKRAGLSLRKKCDLGVIGQFNQLWVRADKRN